VAGGAAVSREDWPFNRRKQRELREADAGLDGKSPWRIVAAVKPKRDKVGAGSRECGPREREASPAHASGSDGEVDISLLENSLAKTPWERMQANDDALFLAETLRVAMERRNAKP
jgi:hypothetical protein